MIYINDKQYDVDEFAYDGKHKIYLINDSQAKKSLLNDKEDKYEIHSIDELEETYKYSDSLRYIAIETGEDIEMLVEQFAEVYPKIVTEKEYELGTFDESKYVKKSLINKINTEFNEWYSQVISDFSNTINTGIKSSDESDAVLENYKFVRGKANILLDSKAHELVFKQAVYDIFNAYTVDDVDFEIDLEDEEYQALLYQYDVLNYLWEDWQYRGFRFEEDNIKEFIEDKAYDLMNERENDIEIAE